MYTKREKEETEGKEKVIHFGPVYAVYAWVTFFLFLQFLLCLTLCVWRESKKSHADLSLSLSLGRVLEQRQVVRQSSYEKKISARVAGRCETSSRIQMIRLELETETCNCIWFSSLSLSLSLPRFLYLPRSLTLSWWPLQWQIFFRSLIFSLPASLTLPCKKLQCSVNAEMRLFKSENTQRMGKG